MTTPTRIRVTDANLDDPVDAAGVLEILNSYASEPVGGGRPLSGDVRERLIPELRSQSHARIFLAFEVDRPIGVAVCFVGFSTFAARPVLNVHDLAVLPEHRGRGAGRALLGAAETHARENGCCKLTLEVQQDNERARSLYESFGFHDFAPGSQPLPTLFLQKGL